MHHGLEVSSPNNIPSATELGMHMERTAEFLRALAASGTEGRGASVFPPVGSPSSPMDIQVPAPGEPAREAGHLLAPNSSLDTGRDLAAAEPGEPLVPRTASEQHARIASFLQEVESLATAAAAPVQARVGSVSAGRLAVDRGGYRSGRGGGGGRDRFAAPSCERCSDSWFSELRQ